MKKNNPAFKMGSNQALLCVVAILIALLVNLILGKLPATSTQFDLTDNDLFTLSEQSLQIAGNLQEPVTIYLLAETGTEDANLVSLIDRYVAAGKNVKMEQVDPVLYPAFAGQYYDKALTDNSIIVECGERFKVIPNENIYVVDYSKAYASGDPNDIIQTFDGEGTITSAISYVTSEDLPVVYALEGHGESMMPDSMMQMVQKDNYTVNTLSLMNDSGVPEDCAALLIVSPRSDLSQSELQTVLTYMENGGSVILMRDFGVGELPNFDILMDSYGIDFQEGVVVERDGNHYYANGYYHYLLPEMQPHPITESLMNGGQYVMIPQAMGIVETENHRSTLDFTPLLITTGNSYAKPNAASASTMEKEEGDFDGPFAVGAVVTEPVANGESRLVCFSTSLLMAQNVDELVSGGNSDLMLNTLGWLCGQEESMAIHAKNLVAEQLVVPASDANFYSIVMVFGLPLFFLLAGAIVVMDRRKK